MSHSMTCRGCGQHAFFVVTCEGARGPEPIGSSRELRVQGLRLQEMESVDKEVGL